MPAEDRYWYSRTQVCCIKLSREEVQLLRQRMFRLKLTRTEVLREYLDPMFAEEQRRVELKRRC